MSARRQLAEQQQELDRLRHETYILKEAQEAPVADSTVQQQLADLQKSVFAYKEQLEASQQQVSSLRQQLDSPQQQVSSLHQQLDSPQQQVSNLHQQLDSSQQQVQYLHQRLSSSQQQVLSLTDQIRTLQQRSESNSNLLNEAHAKSGQIVLVPLSHEGAGLVVDKASGHSYAAKPTGLQHVGKWTQSGGVQLTHPASPVAAGLAQLQHFAVLQQHQLQNFFTAHAQDSIQSIPMQLLPSLLSSILPAMPADELQHLQSMLTAGTACMVTLQDLLAAVEASIAATNAALAAEAAMPQELRLLSAAIQQQQLSELFEAQAGSVAGSITFQQLISVLRRSVRGISTSQMRCLLATLHARGVHDHINLQDIYSALQLHPAPKVLSATHLRSAVNASPSKTAAHTMAVSVELQAVRQQLLQATQAAQHHAQACGNKDAELILLQRAVKQLQQDLHVLRQQEAAASARHNTQLGNEALQAQIRAAGDKAHLLKTRFLETKSAFEQLKTQHARVVQVTFQDMPISLSADAASLTQIYFLYL